MKIETPKNSFPVYEVDKYNVVGLTWQEFSSINDVSEQALHQLFAIYYCNWAYYANPLIWFGERGNGGHRDHYPTFSAEEIIKAYLTKYPDQDQSLIIGRVRNVYFVQIGQYGQCWYGDSLVVTLLKAALETIMSEEVINE